VTAWGIAKWPVLVIIVSIMLAILYWASPNARHGFRWVSPGGLLAVLLWLVASGLFALYVAFFGNYNKVYGTLGGIIIFLIWMWISNTAILLGAGVQRRTQSGSGPSCNGGVPPPETVRRAARRPQAAQRRESRGVSRPRSRPLGLFPQIIL
jgi:membrane protein